MRTVMVRYRVQPDHADENEARVRAVYEELSAVAPTGFGYATMRLDDGVSFVHLAFTEGEEPAPLLELAAFKAFTAALKERCDVPPETTKVELIGNYRLFEPGAVRAEPAISA